MLSDPREYQHDVCLFAHITLDYRTFVSSKVRTCTHVRMYVSCCALMVVCTAPNCALFSCILNVWGMHVTHVHVLCCVCSDCV